MRWLLVPAILVTMSLVIANAISIGVRERRPEMAVMKVLGYGPGTIMALVLGEALLVGVTCGFLSSFGTWYLINSGGGLKFPIAFFPAFMIPADALWWGPLIGGLTAFAGSILPAWSARTVKVSEVFSKVS
jgi:putative ABC transport system permease protein